MEIYRSEKDTYVIQVNDNGEAWLARLGSTNGFLVRDNEELVELFGFMCQFITHHLIDKWRFIVSQADDHPDDDIPF